PHAIATSGRPHATRARGGGATGRGGGPVSLTPPPLSALRAGPIGPRSLRAGIPASLPARSRPPLSALRAGPIGPRSLRAGIPGSLPARSRLDATSGRNAQALRGVDTRLRHRGEILSAPQRRNHRGDCSAVP